MKKFVAVILTLALAVTALVGLTACGGSDEEAATLTIAVPNDTSNEARALLLLQELGYITLDEEVGITATITDITDNPYNLEFKEV